MNNFPPPPPGGQPPYEPPPGGQQPPQQGSWDQPTQVQQPGQYAQPGQQYAQPGQPGAPEDPLTTLDKKRKKQLWIVSAIGAVLIVAAFFGGKAFEKKNYDPGKSGYEAIYNEGAKAGTAAGTKAGQAQGQKEGEASGTEKGKQEGQAAGTKQGAGAALGNFSSWSTTTPYVITMQQGPSDDVPYAVESRTLMQQGIFYKICASGQGVCTETDPNSGGGGSTGQ